MNVPHRADLEDVASFVHELKVLFDSWPQQECQDKWNGVFHHNIRAKR